MLAVRSMFVMELTLHDTVPRRYTASFQPPQDFNATLKAPLSPPLPPPSPPWGSKPVTSSMQDCLNVCTQQGYCLGSTNPTNGAVNGNRYCNGVTTCQYGCMLANRATNVTQCLSWCTASNNQSQCSTTAPYPGASPYYKCDVNCPLCGNGTR